MRQTRLMSGMTLTEMMIAMILGLLISLAVINFYAPLKLTVLESKKIESANEVLRFVTLHLGRSARHSSAVTEITASRLKLQINLTSGQQTQSSLDKTQSGTFTEVYRFEKPNLYCDDGSGEQLLITQIEDLSFSRNGALLSVAVSPEGAPQHMATTTIDFAIRKLVWQAALALP